MRDIEGLVLPRLSPPEVHVVRAFLTERAELASAHPTALVHGDLAGEHILWDAEHSQVNIIDFSDRSIGDPALDFAGLMGYGHEYAARVLERYRGPKDEGTLRRAKLYFRQTALETMAGCAPGLSVYVRGRLRGVQGAVRAVSVAPQWKLNHVGITEPETTGAGGEVIDHERVTRRIKFCTL